MRKRKRPKRLRSINKILSKLVDKYGGIDGLAVELGICDGTLYNWLNLRSIPRCGCVDCTGRRKGERNNTTHAVLKLIKITGCTVEQLFPGYIREKIYNEDFVSVIVEQLRSGQEKKLFYEHDFYSSDVRDEFSAKIKPIWEKLNQREQVVLQLRFGLGDGLIYTFDEIGNMLQITRERVRQIETFALRKLLMLAHSGIQEKTKTNYIRLFGEPYPFEEQLNERKTAN